MSKHLFDKKPQCKTCISLAVCKSVVTQHSSNLQPAFKNIANRCRDFLLYTTMINRESDERYYICYDTVNRIIKDIQSIK